ncbi:hypothetical protein ACS0TY_020019 [Phlomoides rotata]
MNTSGANKGTSPIQPTLPATNPPTEENPRRGGGGNAPHSYPRGRGIPFQRTRGGQSPPIMGVSGQSAFTPYTRPPPPPPLPPQHWISPRSSRPTGGFTGGLGSQGAQVVPVGASGSGGVAAPGMQIGGNPATRKRVNPPGAGAPNLVHCSLCDKTFFTPKALFGHMRSHRGRGWKGTHPPPMFNAEEGFVDLGRLEVRNAAAAGGREEGRRVENGEGASEDKEGQNYMLPDLNNPPPEDST